MSEQTYTGAWPNWTTLTGEIIAQVAKSQAWPYGTKKAKYKYPTGKRYGDYADNLDSVWTKKEKSSWSEQCRMGASCDVFASTAVRASGYDKTIPRGLGSKNSGQFKHLAKSSLWKNVKAYKSSKRKAGDFIIYAKKNGAAHACIADGHGKTYEAGFTSKRYGCTVKATNYKKSQMKYFYVYRPTKAMRKYVQMGDEGNQVKRVQLFLRWAGFLIDTADGVFGNNTYNAVVRFQKECGLEADGKFGVDCVKKAQEWTIESKEKYDGTLPTKTLKQGNKYTTQNKRLQNFLNWYDNYELIRDGEFGALTKKAVKDFQKQEGLVVDGIFGSKCIARAKTVER